MKDLDAFLEGKTTVLLDLDGTLVNSVEAHAISWQEVLREHGHELDLRTLERHIGMGGDKLIQKVAGISDEKELEQISQERSKLFREKYLEQVYPFPRSAHLVNVLRERGLTVFLATASNSDDRDALLRRGGLQHHFHEFVASEDVEDSKPEPDLLHAILAKLDVRPSHCVLVGDTPFDAKAAVQAGVDFIGVESGPYTREEMHHALKVLPSVAELADLLDPSPAGSAL